MRRLSKKDVARFNSMAKQLNIFFKSLKFAKHQMPSLTHCVASNNEHSHS